MLLALRILEAQKSIVSALRQTYSHVFLDEFQDVNDLQYRLIKAAFHGSDAVVTAVGDTNQAIMAWAGALPDIFNRFNVDFAAAPSKLLFVRRLTFGAAIEVVAKMPIVLRFRRQTQN